MPHSFDFDSVEARLFALHHVALGSQEFCARFLIDRTAEPASDYEWGEYLGRLKTLVSGTLIDAAVKIRMLQDFARHEDEELDVQSMQNNAVAGLKIGYATGPLTLLALRESCNKIIHATEAKLVWHDGIAGTSKYEYWTGMYQLTGTEQNGSPWQVVIHVPEWCTAITRFTRDFQDKIDWAHVIKWDE